MDIDQTPREFSFCTHTIKRKGLLVINDTLDDDRFSQNPYVTGGPKIRFYAGYPKIASITKPIIKVMSMLNLF